MKKTSLGILALSASLLLSACSLFGGGGNGGNYTNSGLSSLPPEQIPSYVDPIEGKTYYNNDAVTLSLECSGYFTNYTYFYVDETDENVRVYDNLYFYEKDYFYFVSKDVKNLWASIEGEYDTEAVEEEKENGYDIQINVKKAGIYTLKFNLETKKVKVIYKSEITEPKYFPVEKADIYSGLDKKYVSMTRSASNPDELEYKNLQIDASKGCAIVNSPLHGVAFRLGLEQSCNGKVITYIGNTLRDKSFYGCIDGKINVYFNTKTYEMRAEFADKENSTFYVSALNMPGVPEPEVSKDHPYIFTTTFTPASQYDLEVPHFYGKHVNLLEFNYSEDTIELYEYEYKGEMRSYYRFKELATYNITIDMSTLELTAVKAE